MPDIDRLEWMLKSRVKRCNQAQDWSTCQDASGVEVVSQSYRMWDFFITVSPCCELSVGNSNK